MNVTETTKRLFGGTPIRVGHYLTKEECYQPGEIVANIDDVAIKFSNKVRLYDLTDYIIRPTKGADGSIFYVAADFVASNVELLEFLTTEGDTEENPIKNLSPDHMIYLASTINNGRTREMTNIVILLWASIQYWAKHIESKDKNAIIDYLGPKKVINAALYIIDTLASADQSPEDAILRFKAIRNDCVLMIYTAIERIVDVAYNETGYEYSALRRSNACKKYLKQTILPWMKENLSEDEEYNVDRLIDMTNQL